MKAEESFAWDERYYTELAAAFVRGKLADTAMLSNVDAIALGVEQGLRLHKFKRQAELPRVRKVLGILQGLSSPDVPIHLLDIGSGRGTFLWPLLATFPHFEVTALDLNPVRVDDINAVQHGGIHNVHALVMDAARIELPDKSVDVVTALEVLEHLPQPQLAVREAVRLARCFVLISVPSKEDDNPEHIQLFTRASLETLLLEAGARNVKFDGVPNHLIAMARV